jgi:hypothetical protein
VTIIEHHCLVEPIAIITLQVFDLSTMAGVKDDNLLLNLVEEVEKLTNDSRPPRQTAEPL